jgi:hypothetical protein
MSRIAAACGAALTATGLLLLGRRRQATWGATADEVAADLPGDAFLSPSDVTATRAISIGAPPAAVWPWIAQMGQGRGGLYSYDVLENLVGCDLHSADRIIPECQEVKVGDQFKLHPDVALIVAIVEPGRALVVRSGVPTDEGGAPYDFTWAFVVVGQPDGTTRLVVRERYRYTSRWSRLIVEPLQAISFIMSQKMLRGIKRRAEALPQPPLRGRLGDTVGVAADAR